MRQKRRFLFDDYDYAMTLGEIAEAMEVTPQYVKQEQERALRKLAQRPEVQRLFAEHFK